MLLRFLIFAFVFMLQTSIFAQTPPIETGVPQTLAKWRAANYSNVRYKLNLTLEKMSPVLKGTIEIRVNLAEARPSGRAKEEKPALTLGLLPSQIILDWRKIRGKENLSTVSNVFINGKAAKFEEINEHLVFKEGVVKGENVIKLDFTSPIATSGAAITRYVDKEDGAEYVYSLFVPSDASTAFPVFDQPDLKARFKLFLVVPRLWKAITNGKIKWIQVTDDRRDIEPYRYEFEETQPISTYVFAFAAGDFAEFEDKESSIPSKLYVRKSQSAKLRNANTGSAGIPARNGRDSANESSTSQTTLAGSDARAPIGEVFRLNREGVKFLEGWFDYKFPFPKYDLVLIPEFPFRGMEHAGATFLREDSIIFPTEPTKNDYISRANVIFHEAAHQWFGDTVTMKWFDDLWLKEGFAEFMAYKTLEKVMPEYNAWKIFYERNKQLAYLTDSTRGTTPIYQEIPNLSAAKSAYGNIVYRKAPSFLRQAEFYLGEDKFQIAVRAFLKKHEFANAEWTDLVNEFETTSGKNLKTFAESWVKQKGVFKIKIEKVYYSNGDAYNLIPTFEHIFDKDLIPVAKFKVLVLMETGNKVIREISLKNKSKANLATSGFNWKESFDHKLHTAYIFPNYQDYGYGIFLLDQESRERVIWEIQNEKDDFLRAMMWGSLWDSVREAELSPRDYAALVIKNINVETDESTIQTLLGRVSTAMNYYIPEGGNPSVSAGVKSETRGNNTLPDGRVSASERDEIAAQLENLLIDKMQNAPTLGQRITFYRAFLNIASSDKARNVLKEILKNKGGNPSVSAGAKNAENSNSSEKSAPLLTRGFLPLKTKDKFDIITRLAILGDADAPKLLADLAKTEMSDEAKRYAYAVGAGFPTKEAKEKYFGDFTGNKEISESWIESAFVSFNSSKHAELTLPYLERALAELPNLKRNRKIFFVNGWLGAFIGGQKSEQALVIINKFLADNPNLDKDLRLKILENSDGLERAVKIRAKFAK
ncbi:MAG: M1 family aminopeptidase [Pyrinomonadaceae bacterium]